MTESKKLKVFKMVYENDIEVRKELIGEHLPYDAVEGAWFFLHKTRGFVVSIYNFAEELCSTEIERFNRLFFSDCIEKKTNMLVAAGSRRGNKALDRAEIAELMGFTGKTAVTKCTSLLNKFRDMSILAKKEDTFKGRKIEKWYINPLLCKTYYRVSVELYEMFQDSINIMMANQSKLLSSLKEGLEDYLNPGVTTMMKEEAKKEIVKEQYKESFESFVAHMEDMMTASEKDSAKDEIMEEHVANIIKSGISCKFVSNGTSLSKEDIEAVRALVVGLIVSVQLGEKLDSKKATLTQVAKEKIIFN